MALPKKNRLRKKDFPKLFLYKDKGYSKFFFLIYQKDDKLPERFKLALSVSKKISNKATIRNKIKRLVTEIFKEIIIKSKINKTIILLKPKKEILKSDPLVVKRDLEYLLLSKGIINNK